MGKTCFKLIVDSQSMLDEVMLDIPHTAPPSYKGESVIYLHKVILQIVFLNQIKSDTLLAQVPLLVNVFQ